jgi:hypothetical protein
MQPFLESLAERMLQNDLPLENQVVILPTKRSANFLSKIFAEKADGTLWLPEMFTLNEWASRISGLETAENLLTTFTLYEAYSDTMGGEAQTISEFLSWSSVLLSDFNDIDAYLIEPQSIFRELVDYTEIEQFSFLKSPLSEKQESYRRFWRKLPAIFEKFRKALLEQKIGTSGMIMRRAAEVSKEYFEKQNNTFVSVAGFNALTASEVSLLKAMENSGSGRVYFDADDYLMTPNKNSGRFIRRNVETGLGEILKPPRSFTEKDSKIRVISSGHKLDQANAVAAILEKTSDEDLKKTGLILADESMLMPVIERLPEKVKAVNVTMGLSLSTSAFRNWIEAWLELHTTARRAEGAYYLNTRRLTQVLNHPFSVLIGISSTEALSDSWIKITELENDAATLLNPLHEESGLNLKAVSESINAILQKVIESELSNPEIRMGLLGCEKLLETLNRLGEFSRSRELDLNNLRQIFMRVLASTKLSLLGEPMQGLQIMGVLETRALAFENLIICSVDEGNFPKGSHAESFIPFEVRLFHKLPGRREKEAVFAYQFYRLLSHSENFTAIYHTDTGTFGGGEMSRYLKQVREDFEHSGRYLEQSLKPSEFTHQKNDLIIEKNEKVLEIITRSLVEKGLSASSINRFFESSLEWYYSNILGLSEPETSEIDPSTFGTIVHDCLERLFEPFKGEIISEAILDQILEQVDQVLKDSFTTEAGKKDYLHGINRLHFETAQKMIQSYLKQEKADITDGTEVHYLESERRVERILEVDHQGKKLPVRIKGFIDRIEKRNGILHLIDFKTGNVEHADLKLTVRNKNESFDLEFLTDKLKSKGKALQLLLYDWLLKEENGMAEVNNQIISLAAPGKRDLYLEVEDRDLALEIFEDFLRETVLEMLDASVPIEASEKFQYAVFE